MRDEAYGLLCFNISRDILFHLDGLLSPNEDGWSLKIYLGRQISVTRNISISVETVCSPSLHDASLEQKDTMMYPLPRRLIYLNDKLSLPWMKMVILILQILLRSAVHAKNTENKTKHERNKINQWFVLKITETSNKK